MPDMLLNIAAKVQLIYGRPYLDKGRKLSHLPVQGGALWKRGGAGA